MSKTSTRIAPTTRIVEGRGGQLRLVIGGTPEPDWQLDDRTRSVGRKGVARAREILQRAQPPEPVLKPDQKAS